MIFGEINLIWCGSTCICIEFGVYVLHHVSEYNMYSTRNNVESKLYIPKPNIEIYRQSFQYSAPKFYNSLPTDITACRTSLDQFLCYEKSGYCIMST